MKRLYIDLDDTYKDTERYLRKILESEGIQVPKSLETVYTLVRYATLSNDDELRRVANPLFDLMGKAYGKDFEGYSKEVYSVFEKVMSAYPFIPNRDGVTDCWDLIKSEYKVTLLSAYTTESERKAKEEFAKSMGVEYMLVPYSDKIGMELEEGSIVVDNDLEVLSSFKGVSRRVLMYSEYSKPHSLMGYDYIVFDWYSLCDYLMKGDFGDELRAGIYAGVPLSYGVEDRV